MGNFDLRRYGLCWCGMILAAAVLVAGSRGVILEHATEVLNPLGDSVALLQVREWENGLLKQSTYQAFFHGQNVLLLRKLFPEKERGRAILMQENSLWIELPSARRPLQLSPEQRLTSETNVADLARANFARDYQVERLVNESASTELQHLFLRGRRPDVPYSNVELWLDAKTGSPKRAKFEGIAESLSKECEYRSYQVIFGMRRPVEVDCAEIGDVGWKAEISFSHWVRQKVDPRFLDPSSLGKEESVVVTPNTPHTRREQSGVIKADMVFIPEGPFTMGRDNGFPDEQPSHTVFVKAFLLDRVEVTVAQYRRFQEATHRPPFGVPASASMPSSYFVNDQFDNFPVVDVAWRDAADFCQWAHKRLPTETEFEKAARGTDQRLYPWGNVWDEGKANSRETPYSSVEGMKVHFSSDVGSYSEGMSPYGALDMAGNVWEWVADWYMAYPGNSIPNSAYGRRYRVLRGGSWVSNSLALTAVARDYSNPAFGYDSVGFRCAKDKND